MQCAALTQIEKYIVVSNPLTYVRDANGSRCRLALLLVLNDYIFTINRCRQCKLALKFTPKFILRKPNT